jgi:putative PIN family toxin of toxin-antitoxin system
VSEAEQQRLLRVILDTNIAVSGLLSDGAAAAIVDLARYHPELIRLGASEDTLTELLAVLRKPRLASLLEQRGWAPEEVFALYSRLVDSPVPTTQWQGRWSSDPDDDVFLATAYAFGADLLVTRDEDLLELKQF